jgi:subtilisin family serine protease
MRDRGVLTDRRARLLAVAVLVGLLSSAAPAVVGATTDAAADQAAATPRGAGLHRDALLVRFAAGTADSTAAAVLAAAGATEVGRLVALNTVVVVPTAGRVRGAVQRSLAANRSVASVEADGTAHLTLTPNDTYWSQEWYATKVRTDRAWNITTGTGGPVIAVVDSGVQASQPELVGRVLPGYDFVNSDTNPADDLGHGTKVSGVLAALGMNSLGVAGTCWDCKILPVKVADSAGNVTFSNGAAGIVWATDHGAKVINMSWGKTSANSTLQAAVDYAHSHGAVLIAAAGNEGNKAKFYPAAYPGVLSVAAVDQNDALYSWSTRGLWVRLAAPGCAYTTFKGSNWGSFCGTSAAAPIVSGIAGLILAYKPNATQAEIENAIVSTTVAINVNVGGGRVDAYNAVHKLEPPKTKGGGRP